VWAGWKRKPVRELCSIVNPKYRDRLRPMVWLNNSPADGESGPHYFPTMASDLIGFDSFTLRGDPVTRAKAALRVARHQVRLAYDDTKSWRLESVLSDIEDEIGVQLNEIEDAVDADAAAVEESGEGAARRQAWLPLRAA
jgi:hypothetical protein